MYKFTILNPFSKDDDNMSLPEATRKEKTEDRLHKTAISYHDARIGRLEKRINVHTLRKLRHQDAIDRNAHHLTERKMDVLRELHRIGKLTDADRQAEPELIKLLGIEEVKEVDGKVETTKQTPTPTTTRARKNPASKTPAKAKAAAAA